MAALTIDTTGAYLLSVGGVYGPDGIRFQFTESGTSSAVLSKNINPPGSAVSLTNVAYLNGSLALQSAGTAITGSGLAYVSAADVGLDIYLTVTVTSGTLVVEMAPASIGGGTSGGDIPAGDVTAGTFGSNSGSTGDYSFPDDVTVADVLTADELVGTTSITGTLATAAQANVTSLGTLTILNVDNVRIDGNTISSTAGTDLNITPLAGQQLVLDGTIEIDAGVVTGITDLTATTINGTTVVASGASILGGTAAGGATTAVSDTKAVTAIADNVATTVANITIPNNACTGTVRITAVGVLGAGGAIGAGEASASNSYDISWVRTAGVNAVGDISTAFGVNAQAVAGAATCTAALTIAAVTGAVGDPNVLPIQMTVIKSGGASDNHTALLAWAIINQNASGATLA